MAQGVYHWAFTLLSADTNRKNMELSDTSQEIRLVVMQNKIERLEEKQDEFKERIKALEKWVWGAAAVIAAGVTVTGFATNISKAYL